MARKQSAVIASLNRAAAHSTADNLSNTYGPVFLTAFLCTALWGTTCTQTFTYFISYPKDRLWVKSMVTWLWVMDTAHQAIVIASMYGIFISRYGDVASLAFIPRTFIVQMTFTISVSSTTQLFFAYRIWLFSGKKWIFPIVTFMLVISQFILTTTYMAGILIDNTPRGFNKESTVGVVNIVLAAVTDIALAACMIYLLRKERSGFDTSDQLVGKLMIFSLNSGLWTALVALSTAITTAAVPMPDLVYPGIYTTLCPLYCNTVLANLNSRNFLQKSTPNSQSTPHGGNMALDTFSRSGAARVPQKSVIAIQVDTTKATDNYSYQQGDSDDSKGPSDPSFA